ncbi:MAG: multidrug ABC transporter ATP-binding protein [Myxococcales bacterium]|nr:multidrug ABC transporter ATP-binding protein [Myxococcales bacterium]
MDIVQDLRRIGAWIRPEAVRYALGLGSLLLVNISDVIAPVFMAVAIDLAEAELLSAAPKTPQVLAYLGLSSGDFSLVGAIACYLALHVAANAFRYPMLMNTAVPSHRVGQSVRNRVVDHLMRLSRPFYDRSRSGDLMSLATSDINATRMMFGPAILVGSDTLMIMSLVLVVLATLSWKLTLIAMIPLPIIALVTNALSHAEYNRFEDVQEDLATLTERARESYAGIRIIQGYAREVYDRDRFRAFSWRHFGLNLRLAKVRAMFDPTLDLMLGVSTVLVLIFGGMQVIDGTMTLGTFVAFLFLVRYLSGPMIGLGWSVSLLQRGRASLKRLHALLDEPIEIKDAPDAVEADTNGTLQVDGLTFAYAGRLDPGTGTVDLDAPVEPVLRDVGFTLRPGARLGVIGPVGSGKTTLISLLARLYDPPEGTVRFGGRDVRDITLASLRERVVVAPQDTFLFSDTVARNMLLGSPHQDTDHARELARLAHLADEIDALPRGYETLLGERGVNMSGGQRQRLAIGRAIGADPEVLVLDDCLSAVDARTEGAILDNLEEVFEGRSGIIVSHRVIAVERCDEIIVLEEGRVTERGTHAELIQGDGYYARIAAEQMKAAQSGLEEVTS